MYPAAHLFSLAVWTLIPDEEDLSWVDRVTKSPRTTTAGGDYQGSDYGALVQKMLDHGISKYEVARFAKIVGYNVAQQMCCCLADSTIIDEDSLPERLEWGLYKTENNVPTKRIDLDWELADLDPSRRSMKPKKK